MITEIEKELNLLKRENNKLKLSLLELKKPIKEVMINNSIIKIEKQVETPIKELGFSQDEKKNLTDSQENVIEDKKIEAIEERKSIIAQWKNYFSDLHFKLFLNKAVKINTKRLNLKLKSYKHQTDILNGLENTLNKLKKTEHEHIFTIEKFNTEETKEIFLFNTKYQKRNIFEMLGLFKFDGYLFYINKAESMQIYKIKNMKLIYDLMSKEESYFLVDKMGMFQNKPYFLVKYPIPLTLKIDIDTKKLFWDSKSLYNYINIATKGNLTNIKEGTDFNKFIKDNIIIIIIVILVALVLLIPDVRNALIDFIKGAQQK